jgi:hypothetical protein
MPAPLTVEAHYAEVQISVQEQIYRMTQKHTTKSRETIPFNRIKGDFLEWH